MNEEDKKIVSSRWSFASQKGMRGENIKKIKSIRMNGKAMDRQKITKFFSDISKRTRRDVSYGDVKNVLSRAQKYKIDMTWLNKQKLLAWSKKHSERIFPSQAQSGKKNTSNIAKVEIDPIQSARVESAKKLIASYKNVNRGTTENMNTQKPNSLGIKSVQAGFVRGNSVNPSSLGYNSKPAFSNNPPQGLSKLNNLNTTGLTGSTNVPRRGLY
jgi:hypothetical protein